MLRIGGLSRGCAGVFETKKQEVLNYGFMPTHFKPVVHRMADGLADRVDRLRACGNGVVPLVAAYAYEVLLDNKG